MKIGILSGTFDPVHDGHIALANRAIETSLVNEVWFLPEKSPRRKQNVSSYQHRLNMVEMAANNNEKISVLEVDQLAHNIETLRDLIDKCPNVSFFLLIGADVVSSNWQHFEDINLLSEIITFGRAGMHADITFNHPASSKTIREAIARGELPREIPQPVLEYIHEHRLYQTPAA